MINSLAGVTTQVDEGTSPAQLVTDRATLAQEEEDARQQQDNNDKGWCNHIPLGYSGERILSYVNYIGLCFGPFSSCDPKIRRWGPLTLPLLTVLRPKLINCSKIKTG